LVSVARTIPTTRIEFPFHRTVCREFSAPLAVESCHAEVTVAAGVGTICAGGRGTRHCLRLAQGNRSRIVRARIHHERHQGQRFTRIAFELQPSGGVETISGTGRIVDTCTR